MALHWQWDDRCGEITVEQKQSDGTWEQYEIRLYTGNAFLIMLSENDEDKTYTLYSFFADKEHAKNCLGLNKKDANYENNMFNKDYQRWTKIRLNKKKYRYTKDLVTMLVQAFDNITIEIVTE